MRSRVPGGPPAVRPTASVAPRSRGDRHRIRCPSRRALRWAFRRWVAVIRSRTRSRSCSVPTTTCVPPSTPSACDHRSAFPPARCPGTDAPRARCPAPDPPLGVPTTPSTPWSAVDRPGTRRSSCAVPVVRSSSWRISLPRPGRPVVERSEHKSTGGPVLIHDAGEGCPRWSAAGRTWLSGRVRQRGSETVERRIAPRDLRGETPRARGRAGHATARGHSHVRATRRAHDGTGRVALPHITT